MEVTTKTAYKILDKGRSCCGGKLAWSLPIGETPGDWHEVQGDLVRCRNGLHLTTEPKHFAPRKLHKAKTLECYLAEYDGDTLPENDSSEIVARRVRLLRHIPWAEIDEKFAKSPAMVLLDLIWKNQGDTSGHGASWRRLNDAMQKAVNLSIDSGIHFDEEDFYRIRKSYSPEYWLHIEGCYSRAIGAQHGPNVSAYQAIERHLGRKPFIIQRSASDSRKLRLHEGCRFDWHIDMKSAVSVKVTSFGTVKRKVDGKDREFQCVVACSYKKREGTGYEPDKVDKIFKITHEDISAYHKAIREHKKAADAVALAKGGAA